MGMAPGHTNDSLDPTTYTENQHYTMGWQLCNNLVEVDHTGAAIPELAEVGSHPGCQTMDIQAQKRGGVPQCQNHDQ